MAEITDPVFALIADLRQREAAAMGPADNDASLTSAMNAAVYRLAEIEPATIAGAIAMLEVAVEWDDPDMVKAVTAGLRAIAQREGFA